MAKKHRKRQILDREQREGQLLDAAAQVFSERGYRAASVEEIVDRAGVARGTFYHYFESKQDVFLRLIDLYFTSFAELLQRNHKRLVAAVEDDGNVVRAWRDNVLDILLFHSERPQLAAVIYREALGLDEHFSTKIEELSSIASSALAEEFKLMADRGLIVCPDVELLTTIVAGAMVNLILEYVLRRKESDLHVVADGLVFNQVSALAPRGDSRA